MFICVKKIIKYYRIETEAAKATRIKNEATVAASGVVEEAPAPIGLIQAFLLPNVMSYAIAFGFFKLVSDHFLKC
jgi:predicted secreted protein